MSKMSAVVVNEENSESSSSDDSQSLLCSCNAHQSREAPQGTEVTDLNSSGNKEEKQELQEHQVKPPESVTSTITRRTSECPNAASQSAAFKLPKNINKRSITGETLLHKACMRGDVAQARLLIQAGIRINAEDNAGWTALHEASVVGDVALVEELLKAGANVHARSSNGVTPLKDAVEAGHCEVVKLLLQYGSDVTDRTLGGVAAAEMEKEPGIKEHLQGSAFMQQHHCGASSETSRQPSVGYNSTADVASRERSVREPGDIQPSNKGPDADHSPSDALTVFLEEMKRKQAEMSTWPPAGLQDADRYLVDLTQIQNELTEVLDKQHVFRDNLLQRSRTAPECLLRRWLKNDVALLVARQQTLVEMFHKHVDLVKAFVTTKAKVSSQPFRRARSSAVGRQQPGPSSTPPPASFSDSKTHARNPNSQKKMEQKLDDVFRPAQELFKEQEPPAAAAAASVTSRKNSLKLTGVLTEEAKHLQGNSLESGNPSTCISFRMKAGDALIQGSSEDRSRRLSELIERGLVSPGDVLRLRFKGQRHSAHVQADGGIKDSKGRVHVALEHWLESIAGNNIPVSSAYAWSKVTFREQPLSSYLSTPEAAGQPPPPPSEDHVGAELCQEAPAAGPALTEAHAHSLIRNIQIIHLVSDEDLLPSALLDRHWEKLLEQDWDRW